MKTPLTPVRLLLAMAGLFLLFSGCEPQTDPSAPPGSTGEGYRPIYLSYDELRQVNTQGPRSLRNPGKIYVRGTYLFINEPGEGIHIINNQDPANPQPLAFVNIRGNVDMAVKGNVLYADNATDLVALDITNPQQVQVLNRVENVFPYASYPPATGVQFECVDKTKGVVVGWEKATLENARCRR
jgi:hypothetical protein